MGRSCEEAAEAAADVPFCSLPGRVRDGLAAGFREGRSPDLFAVTRGQTGAGGTAFDQAAGAPTWPSVPAGDASRIPIAFWGTGVDSGAAIPAGTGADDIAPTLARIAGVERPHPEVRSGTPIENIASGEVPRVVLEVVLAGTGSADLEESPTTWPFLATLLDEGAATLDGETGSLPVDPAAVLTTIGTGGLPHQHGITGTLMRNDSGRLVRAWSPRVPGSVIAALGDDLDELLDQRPEVGLVAGRRSDRGLVGGSWYVDGDRDDVAFGAADPVEAAARLLREDYADDSEPDLLAVVLRGGLGEMDRQLRALVKRARAAARGSLTVVVSATGSGLSGPAEMRPAEIAGSIGTDVGDVVEAVAVGGLFLDQKELEATKTSDDAVLDSLRSMRAADGNPLFADVFGGLAISFQRYC